MDTSNDKNTFDESNKSQVDFGEVASNLLHEGKKIANELYENNAKIFCEANESLQEYSDEICNKIKANPLSSLLIAGGIGFLLSAILRK